MAASSNVYVFEGKEPIYLVKWKVEPGSQLVLKKVLLTYKSDPIKDEESDIIQKLESTVEGCVEKLLVKEGEIINPGTVLMTVGLCKHEVIMKELCAICGADLRHLSSQNLQEVVASRSFSMVHVVPELKCSLKKAEELDQADEIRLLASRKLILLVDLDQTLIHTTNDNVPVDLKGVYHFQLYGSHSPWYHTRLRPHTQEFLEKISKLYEMHIFTFGARPYAHKIVRTFLDPNQALFSHRILSRDECFDATSKTGNLKSLFPRGDSMVCIIDDREDVWNYSPNVIHVKPYIYFNNTGDINSPRYVKQSSNILFPPPSSTAATNNEPVPKMSIINEENKSNFISEVVDISNDSIDDDVVLLENNSAEIKKISKDFIKTDEQCSQVDIESTDNEKKEITDERDKEIIDMGKREDVDTGNIENIDTEKRENIDTEKRENIVAGNIENIEMDKEEKPDNKKNEKEKTENTKKGEENSEIEIIEVKCAVITTEKMDENEDLDKTVLVDDQNIAEAVAKRESSCDDDDDYLLYLEEILVKIHRAFYNLYDESQSKGGVKKIPDLKKVIPYVRRRVLRGVNLVFSGVIPTNLAPEKSPLWTLAKSLGAEVSHDLISHNHRYRTTHVVASKAGTVKLARAKRMGNIHIVTPSWLMCCATRWEHVDERLFPLKKSESPSLLLHHKRNKSKLKKTHIFHHRKARKEENTTKVSVIDQSLQTMETVLDFSAEELDNMGKEVDEACTSSDNESSEDEDDDNKRGMKRKLSSGENRDNSLTDDKKYKSVSTEISPNSTFFSNNITNGDSCKLENIASSSDDSILSSNDDELAAELERQILNE